MESAVTRVSENERKISEEYYSVPQWAFSVKLDKDVSIFTYLLQVWEKRIIAMVIIAVFTIAALIISISSPNIYRAEIVVSPTGKEKSNLSSLVSSQIGGLVGLGGLNVNADSKTIEALAVLESRDFLVRFVRTRGMSAPLIATEWSTLNQKAYIDDNIYNQKTNEWQVDENGHSYEPTDWQLYSAISDILSVRQDVKTGIVTLAVDWTDATLAASWANWLIEDLNSLLRDQERDQAKRSIAYLRTQLGNTTLVDMRNAFFQLIESQLKIVMLTDARKDYSFFVIDPALAPEKKIAPRRTNIVITGIMIGSIASILIILLFNFLLATKKNLKYLDQNNR